MTQRALAVCLAALCGSCSSELAPIVLDISKNCNEVEVHVLADNLGESADGTRDEILDVAADYATSASSWVLVVPAGGEAGNLYLRRLAGDQVVSEVSLGVSTQFRDATHLRTSPDADEVYVTVRTPDEFRVLRVLDRDPVPFVQGSMNMVAFPNDSHTCQPCDTSTWYRDLIFVEGAPYLVSVPPFSPSVAISVWVGRLETSNSDISDFRLASEHRLNFEPRCDPDDPDVDVQLCQASNALVSHPNVQVLGRQSDPRTGTAALFASRERVEEGNLASAYDVFVVLIGLDNDGVPAGILRSEQSDFIATQPPGPPSGLAVDPFATYTLVTMPGEGPQLLRLPRVNFDDGFTELQVPNLEGQSLAQLDGDIALTRVLAGAFEVTKLFPDSVEQSQTTRYETDAPILEARPAGPGRFVLRRGDAAPQLVTLVCAGDDSVPLP